MSRRIALVALLWAICIPVFAQVDLPKIVWHPEVHYKNLFPNDPAPIINDFRANPLPQVQGVALCAWTLSDGYWNPPEQQYDDVPSLIAEGYTLGAFGYWHDKNGNTWTRQILLESQIPNMEVRLVICDEPEKFYITSQEMIDMSDACREVNADVLFTYSGFSYDGLSTPRQTGFLCKRFTSKHILVL